MLLVACRDIKPENILFSSDMVLKLADLGLAVNLLEEPAVTRVGRCTWWSASVLAAMIEGLAAVKSFHNSQLHAYSSDRAACGCCKVAGACVYGGWFLILVIVAAAGTLEYMPPEVLRCPLKRHPADNKSRTELHYTTAVDSWAAGVLAYELLTGRWVQGGPRVCGMWRHQAQL